MTPDTDSPAYHHGVIARAIARIDAAGGAPLPLDRLAAELGMSPAHFQRVFTRWAGVSPKRYQQSLALGRARELLAARRPLIEVADAAGLSGPGRLHDLFLRWEAMSPGAHARGGEGLEIAWGWFDSPFGPALVMATGRGICGIGFAAETGRDATFADLAGRWPRARLIEAPERIRPWALAAFGAAPGTGAELPLFLIGAPFHLRVWEALLAIPSGQVTTYGAIAAAVGRRQAVRAVGRAVGRNPVAWLIPCHRVLRRTGGLGGYHWGLGVKRAMLAWEAARAAAASPDGRETA